MFIKLFILSVHMSKYASFHDLYLTHIGLWTESTNLSIHLWSCFKPSAATQRLPMCPVLRQATQASVWFLKYPNFTNTNNPVYLQRNRNQLTSCSLVRLKAQSSCRVAENHVYTPQYSQLL